MTYYYYKKGDNFIITRSPLDEPLPTGFAKTSKTAYERHLAQIKAQSDAFKKSDSYIKAKEIAQLKNQLLATDYKAIKYAEGAFTEEEYAPIKAQRQAWRARINELESEDE